MECKFECIYKGTECDSDCCFDEDGFCCLFDDCHSCTKYYSMFGCDIAEE